MKTITPPLQAVTQAFQNEAWAITPAMHAVIQNIVLERAQGQKPDLSVLETRIEGNSYGAEEANTSAPTIGIVSLHGVLINRAGMMDLMSGATSPQAFVGQVRRFADDSAIDVIVLDIDSPGGTVSGTQAAGEAVAYATARKRTIACVNDKAYSAAYWVASQAGEVVVPSAGGVGSIGVIMTHFDMRGAYAREGIKPTVLRSTELKALGQDSEPMTGKALQQTQKQLQQFHSQFVQAIADGRGVSLEDARAWATGETWLGEDAVALGLADRIGSLQSTLDELIYGAQEVEEPDSLPAAALDIDPSHTPPDAGLEARASPADFQPAHPQPEASPSDPGAVALPTSAPQAQEDSVNLKDILAKIEAGQQLSAEERSFLDSQLSSASAPQLDLGQLSPEARAAVERAEAKAAQAQAEAQAAQATANAERSARLDREFQQKARSLGLPDSMGATLREASENLSAESYQAFEQALSAKGAQEDLLAESGSGQDRSVGMNPEATYEAKVREYLEANPGASRATAARAVMAANPELRQRYR